VNCANCERSEPADSLRGSLRSQELHILLVSEHPKGCSPGAPHPQVRDHALRRAARRRAVSPQGNHPCA